MVASSICTESVHQQNDSYEINMDGAMSFKALGPGNVEYLQHISHTTHGTRGYPVAGTIFIVLG